MALPFIIASKTLTNTNVSLSLTSGLTCNDNEDYKTLALITGAGSFWEQSQEEIQRTLLSLSCVLQKVNGRAALVYLSSPDTGDIVQFVGNTGQFSYSVHDDFSDTDYDYDNQTGCFANAILSYNRGNGQFSSNIPIFGNEQTALSYINAQSEESAHLILAQALNYEKSEYNPETTQNYTYSCFHSNVDLLRGTITPTSEIGYRTLKFQANTKPAFYLNEGSFEMTLIAPDVIASVYAAGPEQVADNIPESQWTEETLAYNGPFYCPLSVYIEAFDETPGDGSYVYPTQFQTNIEIYSNREDAEEAIRTGDNSKAIRRGPSKEYDVKIGDEEQETEFGGGGFMSPFFTILSGSKTDIHRLADFLFSDDQSVWEDIKKGLEMYGSNPIDYIISLKAFPFNVDRVVNESERYTIFFGSYEKRFDTPFNEVINMAHKYIDAGSFFMYPIQYCYLDFEPYTTLSAYFPYHGWEQLDIKKYYQKNVNVRYYVDILTGQSIIVTVCDGVITDQFGPCEIGTELPLTGANFAQWAQGQVRLLTQAASSLVGGISGGVTSGNVAGFAASSLTSMIPASQALHEARQQGGPKNTMITKGNFGSNLGNYLPGYVIFRFDIHEMLEPDLLQPLAGRPSYSSGVIRNFSGFVSGKVVKMDTSGMSDSEANRIKQMIMNGIYV